MPSSSTTTSRKRTRSPNTSEDITDHEQATSTTATSTAVSSQSTSSTLRKRQRNNPSSTSARTNYSLRNRSVTTNGQYSSARLSSIDASTNSRPYNLRPRYPQSQIIASQDSSSHLSTVPNRTRNPNLSSNSFS